MDAAERRRILAREMRPWIEEEFYEPRLVTDHSAYLVQPRTWSPWWLLAWFIIVPVLGGIFYVAYGPNKRCKTVTLTLDESGGVWVQENKLNASYIGSVVGQPEPPPVTKRTLRRRQRRHLPAPVLASEPESRD